MARRKLDTVRTAREVARQQLAIAAQAPRDPNHLGDLVWWDCDSEWMRAAKDVRDEYQALGLNPDHYLPEVPDWFTAFGRAVDEVRGEIRPDGLTLIDAAKGPLGERRVSVVSVHRNGQVTTTDNGTVACARDGETRPYIDVVRTGAHSHVLDQIIDRADKFFERYISADVRNHFVDALVRFSALPCRQAPPHVVYWVPPAARDQVRALADAVEAIGWGHVELFAGSAQDPRSKRAVTRAVNDGLEAKLRTFKAEVERYATAPHDSTRPTTIENKILEAKRLREQAAFYREVLGAACVGVDERIDQIERTLKLTLGFVEAAHA